MVDIDYVVKVTNILFQDFNCTVANFKNLDKNFTIEFFTRAINYIKQNLSEITGIENVQPEQFFGARKLIVIVEFVNQVVMTVTTSSHRIRLTDLLYPNKNTRLFMKCVVNFLLLMSNTKVEFATAIEGMQSKVKHLEKLDSDILKQREQNKDMFISIEMLKNSVESRQKDFALVQEEYEKLQLNDAQQQENNKDLRRQVESAKSHLTKKKDEVAHLNNTYEQKEAHYDFIKKYSDLKEELDQLENEFLVTKENEADVIKTFQAKYADLTHLLSVKKVLHRYALQLENIPERRRTYLLKVNDNIEDENMKIQEELRDFEREIKTITDEISKRKTEFEERTAFLQGKIAGIAVETRECKKERISVMSKNEKLLMEDRKTMKSLSNIVCQCKELEKKIHSNSNLANQQYKRNLEQFRNIFAYVAVRVTAKDDEADSQNEPSL